MVWMFNVTVHIAAEPSHEGVQRCTECGVTLRDKRRDGWCFLTGSFVCASVGEPKPFYIVVRWEEQRRVSWRATCQRPPNA